MLLEIFLILGAIIIYFLASKKKEETLPFKEGWWGKGQKPDTEEDATIRPFKVETTEEELSVSESLYWGKRSQKWPNKYRPCWKYFLHWTNVKYLWKWLTSVGGFGGRDFPVFQKIERDRQISHSATLFCFQLSVSRLLVNKPPLEGLINMKIILQITQLCSSLCTFLCLIV